jgi:hypothetical protein
VVLGVDAFVLFSRLFLSPLLEALVATSNVGVDHK